MGKDKKKKDKSSKSKRSHRASADSDSDGSDDSRRRRSDASDADEKERKKRARKEEKEMLKQEIRVHKEAQIADQIASQLGYSNKDNPFGDNNLHSKFVWVKKREKEMKEGLTREERLRRDIEKKAEVARELERLKGHRAQRDMELQLREQEAARLKREQDRAALGDWERREDVFHYEMAKTRAKIRIREGRAKPIDLLAINVSLASDSALATEFDALGYEMDTDDPCELLTNLNLSEIQELHKDIRTYMELETVKENKPFWESLLIICDDQLARVERAKSGTKLSNHEKQTEEEIVSMLSNKTYSQLQTIKKQVDERLSDTSRPVDVEFWETVLKALVVWTAKARLRDMHKAFLEVRLERLRDEALAKKPEDMENESGGKSEKASKVPIKLGKALLVNASELAAKEAAEKAAKALKEMESLSAARGAWSEEMNAIQRGEENIVEKYDPSMSPLMTEHLLREDRGFEIVDEEEDYDELIARRREILAELNKPVEEVAVEMSAADALEDSFIKTATMEMEEDEEAFADEAKIVDKTQYLWQDKYRPRKPRYFNRVHTGYEWNKYNQTHYDSDNPPPKVVQGYKFNIFYPDLIDKTKTPTYRIEKDSGYPDTVILRFIASAPYEDIAFRIVRKEWEYGHKSGFRSSFDRGVLQLHFHFKRQFYRR